MRKKFSQLVILLSQRKPIQELAMILCLTIAIWSVSQSYDLFELLVDFVHNHESWEVDEILVVSIYLVIALGLFAFRRWQEQRLIEEALKQQLTELNEALREIRQLQGIIPICASCKNIRDDQGYWHQVESYIRNHSHADFSHGICPDCMSKLYPGHTQRTRQIIQFSVEA